MTLKPLARFSPQFDVQVAILLFALFFIKSAFATQIDPNTRLSLDFVLSAAKRSSSLFKSTDASALSIDSARLSAEAPLSPRLSFGMRRLDDRNEPPNPFAPNMNRTTTYFLGYQQGLSWSGTQLGLELRHGNTSLNFPTTRVSPYYETYLQFTVRQSILQSLILGADRKRLEAGFEGSIAEEKNYKLLHDQTTLDVIQSYYQAWLAQADVRAAETNLKNRLDVHSITKLKSKRGTAEKPDLLQAEAGKKSAEIQLEESKRNLGDIWRSLVIGLGLPEGLLAVDPLTIPVDLDSPVEPALARCQNYSKSNAARSEPISLSRKAAESRAKSSLARAGSLGASSGTDLVLSGSYATNGIDNSTRGATWRSTGNREYPAWSFEIAAQIPLGASQFDGDAKIALSDSVRATAAAERERDMETVEIQNRCLELEQKNNAFKNASEIFIAQSERHKLEDQRFKIGRSSLTQVVIASDDRVAAEQNLKRAEISRRLSAWRVFQIEGSLFELALNSTPQSKPGGK